MFIRSERLFLRPGWPEDWQEILARISDEAVVKNLAAAPWPYTADHARAFIDAPQERLLPSFLMTVPDAEGSRLVGCAGLARYEGDVELRYWVAREHWGQGYATEAARAVLGLARALGHRRVVACHFADNLASARVLAKAGFRPTGEVKPRFCRARGHAVAALGHAIELSAPNDCGDDDDGGAMRAA